MRILTRDEKRLETLFTDGHWLKGGSKGHIRGKGMCYCLSAAVWEHYPLHADEVRLRLLTAIEKLFPERHSEFALKLAKVQEPMLERKYSLVTFNDHPETTLKDIILVCKEARV